MPCLTLKEREKKGLFVVLHGFLWKYLGSGVRDGLAVWMETFLYIGKSCHVAVLIRASSSWVPYLTKLPLILCITYVDEVSNRCTPQTYL